MKTIIKILLGVSILFLAYFAVMSIVTPIQFDEEKARREAIIIQSLTDLRNAEVEFKEQNGVYTDNYQDLFKFLRIAKKKTVLKEGSLSDKQLEAGLTEEAAAKIVRSGNAKAIAENGLQNFRRDTAYVPMIEALYPEKYTAENIENIANVPFSENAKFKIEVNNTYMSSNGIKIPLFQASVLYEVYLHDLNRQEVLNKIDIQNKLTKFPGLMVGSVTEPNNNAGNWE